MKKLMAILLAAMMAVLSVGCDYSDLDEFNEQLLQFEEVDMNELMALYEKIDPKALEELAAQVDVDLSGLSELEKLAVLADVDWENLEEVSVEIDSADLEELGINLDALSELGITKEDFEQAIIEMNIAISEIEAENAAEAEEVEETEVTEEAEEVEETEVTEEAEEVEETEVTEEAEEVEETEVIEEAEAEEDVAEDAGELVTCIPPKRPRLEDDFYSYTNFDRVNELSLPAGHSSTSKLRETTVITENQIKDILNELKDTYTEYDDDSPEYRLGALYASLLDMDAREQTGYEPIAKWVDMIESARCVADLKKIDKRYLRATGESLLLYVTAMDNLEDSTTYVCDVSPAIMSLGKAIMTDPDMQEYRDCYLDYLNNIFSCYGFDEEEAARRAERVFDFDTEYEQYTLSPAQLNNPEYVANSYSQKKLVNTYRNLPIKSTLKQLSLLEDDGVCGYNVTATDAFAFYNEQFTNDNLETYQNLMIVTLLELYSTVLTKELYDVEMEFENALSGITDGLSFEESMCKVVTDLLETDLGKVYVSRYCSEETKTQLIEMTQLIIDNYREMIEKTEWMTEETREKAIEKLDKIRVFAAYPDDDQWDDSLENLLLAGPADGGTPADNLDRIKLETARSLADKIKNPVDKNKWITYPQTVNAFYNSTANSITLCAALMQGKIFDPEEEFGTNLGGAGYVIAHEISHAFDSNGAQFDADGNVDSWWTEEDWAGFEELKQKVVDYYDQYEIMDGYTVDGELTVSENMADLGAISCIGRICDDDTEMFKQACDRISLVWCQISTMQDFEMRLKSDTHSPAKARVNVPIQMCDLFYEAYDIKEEDGMYVAPEDRIGIWR